MGEKHSKGEMLLSKLCVSMSPLSVVLGSVIALHATVLRQS